MNWLRRMMYGRYGSDQCCDAGLEYCALAGQQASANPDFLLVFVYSVGTLLPADVFPQYHAAA